VHDSFWTHAGSVPLMNQILRDEFIKLYSETSSDSDGAHTVLQRLRRELLDRYGRNVVPTRGFTKHIQRQKSLKRPDTFQSKDWRAIRIPELPFKEMEMMDEKASGPTADEHEHEQFDVRQVAHSDYFFH
jgi:DNA-directed RNA polymerase